MAKMIAVTGERFVEDVLGSAEPVVVDFWAPWCGPCRKLTPVVEALADEYPGGFRFVRLDVDADRDIALAYGVEGIPTLLLFFGGLPVGRFEGPLSKEQLTQGLDEAMPLVA